MEELKRTTISMLPSTTELLKINKSLCGVSNWDHYFLLNMAILNDFALEYNRVFNEVVRGERNTFPNIFRIKKEGVKEVEVPEEIKDSMKAIVYRFSRPATE